METEEALRCVDDGESGVIGIALAAEVRKLRTELSHGWQQSFYHAQHTIELQKERLSILEHNDRMFRKVIDILTEQNGSIVPNWLLDLEI